MVVLKHLKLTVSTRFDLLISFIILSHFIDINARYRWKLLFYQNAALFVTQNKKHKLSPLYGLRSR